MLDIVSQPRLRHAGESVDIVTASTLIANAAHRRNDGAVGVSLELLPMRFARPIGLLLLLTGCHRAAAWAPGPSALADPAPLGGVWQIDLWRGSDIPLYEDTPIATRRPPWVSGTITFIDSTLIGHGIRGDTIHGIARLEVRSDPDGTSAELPEYPAVAVHGTDGRVWLRVDLAPRCTGQSCSRLLELTGTLSGDRMRGDWRFGNRELSTSGPGVVLRVRGPSRTRMPPQDVTERKTPASWASAA